MLIWVEQGQKQIRYKGGKSVTIYPGEAAAISADKKLEIRNCISDQSEVYRTFWLSLDDALINDMYLNGNAQTSLTSKTTPTMKPISIAPIRKCSEVFRHAIERAAMAIREPENYPEPVAKHLMAELLVWLGLEGYYFAPNRNPSLSSRIRKFISQNPSFKWSATDVAKRFAMSEATLRRHLSTENDSFNNILIDVRMTHALSLLQCTETSITQIAFESGYASTSRFTARFKARFNCLPTEIRKASNNTKTESF